MQMTFRQAPAQMRGIASTVYTILVAVILFIYNIIWPYLARQVRVRAHLHGDIADRVALQIRTDVVERMRDGRRCDGGSVLLQQQQFGGGGGGCALLLLLLELLERLRWCQFDAARFIWRVRKRSYLRLLAAFIGCVGDFFVCV